MSGYYRLLFSLLCYMVGDVLGMLAVGYPNGFGAWTLAGSVVIFLNRLHVREKRSWVASLTTERNTVSAKTPTLWEGEQLTFERSLP